MGEKRGKKCDFFQVLFQNFKSILKLVEEAFFKHVEEGVLGKCAKAMEFSAQEAHGKLREESGKTITQVGEKVVQKLVDSLHTDSVISPCLPSGFP